MEMEKNEPTNWLERMVTVIAGILVLFTFVFLIYQWISEETTPPNIVVNLGEVVQKDQGYSVPVSVNNLGTQTAKDIVIEIVSKEVDSEEKGQISFQYLPGKSSVRGWVTFTKNPSRSSLKTQVLGYSTP